MGRDLSARIDYGLSEQDQKKALEEIRVAVEMFGSSTVARAAGISRQHLTNILSGASRAGDATLKEILSAVSALVLSAQNHAAEVEAVLSAVEARCHEISQRRFAEAAGLHPGNFSRFLKRERPIGRAVLVQLKKGLALTAGVESA